MSKLVVEQQYRINGDVVKKRDEYFNGLSMYEWFSYDRCVGVLYFVNDESGEVVLEVKIGACNLTESLTGFTVTGRNK